MQRVLSMLNNAFFACSGRESWLIFMLFQVCVISVVVLPHSQKRVAHNCDNPGTEYNIQIPLRQTPFRDVTMYDISTMTHFVTHGL